MTAQYFIEKLKIRLAEEETKSLNNIKKWRECGARDAELNSNGEVVAFSIVKNIIQKLEKEIDRLPDLTKTIDKTEKNKMNMENKWISVKDDEIEKLAEKAYPFCNDGTGLDLNEYNKSIWKEGFKASQEQNTKRYEEDLRKAFEAGHEEIVHSESSSEQKFNDFEDYLESLHKEKMKLPEPPKPETQPNEKQ